MFGGIWPYFPAKMWKGAFIWINTVVQIWFASNCTIGILLTPNPLVCNQLIFEQDQLISFFSGSSRPTDFYDQSKQMIYKASTGTKRTS